MTKKEHSAKTEQRAKRIVKDRNMSMPRKNAELYALGYSAGERIKLLGLGPKEALGDIARRCGIIRRKKDS